MDSGLLIGRLVFGLIMAAHGSQKLFGWLGGHGLAGTSAFFESLGWRPGRLFAAAAATAEVGGGLLTALGLFGPIGPAIMVSVMVVAMSVHWQNGLFAMSNGIEVPLAYAAAGATLALAGPGGWSADAALGLARLWTPAMAWTALTVGILGGLANVAIRNAGQRTAAA